jgi:hypothetical protein
MILSEYRKLNDKVEHRENLTFKEKSDMEDYKQKLQYLLMRQNFISPSYLPTVSENFLRDDFNFAEYLTLCLDKSLTQLYKFSVASILVIAIIFFYWGGLEITQIPVLIVNLLSLN